MSKLLSPESNLIPGGEVNANGDVIASEDMGMLDYNKGKHGHQGVFKNARILRDLLFVLTWRDVKIKYKQSVMGFMWAILMPAIIVGAGMMVRVVMSKMTGEVLSSDQLATMSVKALPWAFFVSAIRFATNSLTGNVNLVTKINCPRMAFPVSAVLSSLFDLAVAIIPTIFVLAWCRVSPSFQLLWVPILLALLVLFVSGLGMALAAVNLFFRDIKYIVEVILTFAIFFTPILYEANMLGEWKFWIMLNPLSPIVEGLRSAVVLHLSPEPGWLAYSIFVSILTFSGGWYLFDKLEPEFADSI